jgi:type IV secretory pathway TrbL component
MNLALSLIVQCLVLILVITIISQIVGKYLVTDYQEDFEK